MVEFGPIQIIALGFPDVNKLKGEVLKGISRLSEAKIIGVRSYAVEFQVADPLKYN